LWEPSLWDFTYVVQKSVAIPVPSLEQLDALALRLGPCIAIRKRREQSKDNEGKSQEHNDAESADHRFVLEAEQRKSVGNEVVDLAKCDDREV
jgi:hypothetical protein